MVIRKWVGYGLGGEGVVWKMIWYGLGVKDILYGRGQGNGLGEEDMDWERRV